MVEKTKKLKFDFSSKLWNPPSERGIVNVGIGTEEYIIPPDWIEFDVKYETSEAGDGTPYIFSDKEEEFFSTTSTHPSVRSLISSSGVGSLIDYVIFGGKYKTPRVAGFWRHESDYFHYVESDISEEDMPYGRGIVIMYNGYYIDWFDYPNIHASVGEIKKWLIDRGWSFLNDAFFSGAAVGQKSGISVLFFNGPPLEGLEIEPEDEPEEVPEEKSEPEKMVEKTKKLKFDFSSKLWNP